MWTGTKMVLGLVIVTNVSLFGRMTLTVTIVIPNTLHPPQS